MEKFKKIFVDYPISYLISSTLLSILIGFLTSMEYFTLTHFESFLISFLSLIVLILAQISMYAIQIVAISSLQEKEIKDISNIVEIQNNLNNLKDEQKIKSELVNIIHNTEKAVSVLSHNSSKIDLIFKNAIIKQLKRTKETLEEFHNGIIRVEGDEAHSLWCLVIKNVKKSFFTTNIYACKDVLLGSSKDDIHLNLQKEIINNSNNPIFERYFIYDNLSTDEEKELETTINRQKDIGIKAEKLSENEFNELSKVNSWIEKIGSEDFSIIDNEYLYISVIDQNSKRIKYVELYKQGRNLSSAIEFSNIIKSVKQLFPNGYSNGTS